MRMATENLAKYFFKLVAVFLMKLILNLISIFLQFPIKFKNENSQFFYRKRHKSWNLEIHVGVNFPLELRPKLLLQFLGSVCGKGIYSWTVSSSAKAAKLNRFHVFFTYISTSFSSSEERSSVPYQPGMPSTVQISTQSTAVGLWLRRRNQPFRFRRCF